MSRSGYSDDCESVHLWRQAVSVATHGKRGQRLLRDMLSALDAMPAKRLITDDLVRADGECCALGAVAVARGLDTKDVEPSDRDYVADMFDIAPALAAEIVYENDEFRALGSYAADGSWRHAPEETPEERWTRMRAWVAAQVLEVKP